MYQRFRRENGGFDDVGGKKMAVVRRGAGWPVLVWMERVPGLRGSRRWWGRGGLVSLRLGALRNPEQLVRGWLSIWDGSAKSTWAVL